MPLFTRWAWHAYRLVERLRELPVLLVAGGPHATVCPEEALAQGFDVALGGEAERSLVALVSALEAGASLDGIPGLHRRTEDGRLVRGPPVQPIEDLDALAPPHEAGHLFDPAWYGRAGPVAAPGGLLTSRGCPSGCTFCANQITGRSFRHRSPAGVVEELNAVHAATGQTFFPFWDDALTADLPRLEALCQALEQGVRFPLRFSAITRADRVTPGALRALRRAGLVHVSFGVESGDDAILRAIRKGLTTDQVVQALGWARDEGLTASCSFMLGFPEDTPATLQRTAQFLERIAPLVDTFSTLGVVIPFPGTPLYERHHAAYGFTDWWLRASHAGFTPLPAVDAGPEFHRAYLDDATLDLDFFRYDDPTREAIRVCLRIKGEHNLRRMGLRAPAAGDPGALSRPGGRTGRPP